MPIDLYGRGIFWQLILKILFILMLYIINYAWMPCLAVTSDCDYRSSSRFRLSGSGQKLLHIVFLLIEMLNKTPEHVKSSVLSSSSSLLNSWTDWYLEVPCPRRGNRIVLIKENTLYGSEKEGGNFNQ